MKQSFIERQFPVSKVSKESYKERMANNGQTLTGLGKWWGRKPLILVRAAILGCLLPASENPAKDMDIFLKILGMDDEGLLLRKEKKFSIGELFSICSSCTSIWNKYGDWFDNTGSKLKLLRGAPRAEMEAAAFATLSYDRKIAMCKRPEQVNIESEYTWADINHHLGTHAHNLNELTKELSEKKYGHDALVGDCFCGGGSIPFEAARIGCNAYASDLNPIAGILTWAAINVCGADPETVGHIVHFQENIYQKVEEELEQLGIECNERGDKAIAYLYCIETICPECGIRVPLAPSWVIGKRTKTIATLKENGAGYDIEIIMNAPDEKIKAAANGTVTSRGLVCPHCGKITPISSLRHDRTDKDGRIIYGLRQWEENEFEPQKDDVYQERLYAVKYLTPEGNRYYRAPRERDLQNEEKVRKYVAENIIEWQKEGLVSTSFIENGYNTDQVIRERGWRYWHQLFNARQILLVLLYEKNVLKHAKNSLESIVGLLTLNRMLNWNSKLCMWSSYQSQECGLQTFYNQAFNTFFNYSVRALTAMKDTCVFTINNYPIHSQATVELKDARDVSTNADIWITDPPYADAVNYHELSEFFLGWDRLLIQKTFPEWYTDSKRVLAVRGDGHFSQTMINIYRNLTQHMTDDGMQVVMFTHSNPAVWAQLALIMWKSGLTVTAAWNIATETDAGGIYDGNYVKGTVLLILRKQLGDDEAFLDELFAEVKSEVKNQIESMQDLDDREDPNFSDPDYVLAAYAASLKVLTGYKSIVEIDLDYELDLAIHDPSKSEVVKLIERAKKIAYDFIIPLDFDHFLWRDLSAAERFYVKGLEAEKHGNYQISTYQEYARGFGLTSYSQLMANERANTARLKVPQEFGMRTVGDVPGFEQSILRLVLASIHVAIKEDENPEKGFWHIKNNLADYWGRRDMLRQLFSFLKDTEDIDTMPHWHEAAIMASHIYTMIDNDHI